MRLRRGRRTSPPLAAPAVALARANERLAVLRRYAILDTPREPEFDELLERAMRQTGYPAALCHAELPAWEEARWLEREVREAA